MKAKFTGYESYHGGRAEYFSVSKVNAEGIIPRGTARVDLRYVGGRLDDVEFHPNPNLSYGNWRRQKDKLDAIPTTPESMRAIRRLLRRSSRGHSV